MEPSSKRQRIAPPAYQRGAGRHSSGRFYDATTSRERSPNANEITNDNDFGGFYGAVNAREASADFEESEFEDEADYDDVYEDEAPEANLEVSRQRLDNKLKSTFEAIFEKYAKDFTGVGDEIDLRTGEIVVDNGHVAKMQDETDAGEGKGRGRGRDMLRAFTEEPEQSRHRLKDSHDVIELSDDTDEDYHARGRQMLRAFTQEPEGGPETDTEEDDDEYDANTAKQNTIVISEDDSDEDDILYQRSGVIPVNAMAPPPKPSPYNRRQPALQSIFHAPKPTPKPKPRHSNAPYNSEPDIAAEFGQELGPRIAEYVSHQKSLDDASIDPKWWTPALPAVTPGKRPILKSIILQPDPERSPSPKGQSLWAAPGRKKRRRSRGGSSNKEREYVAESETIVRDRTFTSRETITTSRVSAQPVQRRLRSGRKGTPRRPSENVDRNLSTRKQPASVQCEPDDETEDFDYVESITEDTEVSEVEMSKPAKRSKPPKKKAPTPPPKKKIPKVSPVKSFERNLYTPEEDQLLKDWVKWVYFETDYSVWPLKHWNLLSAKYPRHSSASWRQHYRQWYSDNGDKHVFSTDPPNKDAPRTGPPTLGNSTTTVADASELKHVSENQLATVAQVPEAPSLDDILAKRRREEPNYSAEYIQEQKEKKKEALAALYKRRREAIRKKNLKELRAAQKYPKQEEKADGISFPVPYVMEMGEIETPNDSIVDRENGHGNSAVLEEADLKADEPSILVQDDLTERHDGDQMQEDCSDSLLGISKLSQGALEYISADITTSIPTIDVNDLPANAAQDEQHLTTNLVPGTTVVSQGFDSRTVPNSQSSAQDQLSPRRSEAPEGLDAAPAVPFSVDIIDPTYMFSDEEDETGPAFRQTQSQPQNLPPMQVSSIEPQNTTIDGTPTRELEVTSLTPTQQRDLATTATLEIKDELQPDANLGDIYNLSPKPPPSSTTPTSRTTPLPAPQPSTASPSFHVVITQPTSTSRTTPPPAHTRTPTPNNPPAEPTKATPTPKPTTQPLSALTPKATKEPRTTPTPRRATELLRSTPTPTSSRLLSPRSTTRARASSTPRSRRTERVPLVVDIDDDDDDDDEAFIPRSRSQSRRAPSPGSGVSSLETRGGVVSSAGNDGAGDTEEGGAGKLGTPLRPRRSGSGGMGEGEDGMVRTPGGAWRRCGEEGFRCQRGICFLCSA